MSSHRARLFTVLAALTIVGSTALAGCGISSTQPPEKTDVALVATPWPAGTVGKYGLRVDPQLLADLPEVVGGLPLVESASMEAIALDDSDQYRRFDSFAAAQAGALEGPDWIAVYVAHVRDDDQTASFYSSWRSEFFTGACSQAGGVAGQQQEDINDWKVDVATCSGGLVAYTLWIQDGRLLSIQELGGRGLGRQLIEALD